MWWWLSGTIQMHLRVMEDKIGLCVSARDHIEPQLPHEEHKIGYVDWATCRTHTHQRGLCGLVQKNIKCPTSILIR